MKLSQLETQSALWKKLTEHWAERLRVARLKNDNDLEPVETAKLRGKIATYNEDLALGEPDVIVTDTIATEGWNQNGKNE